MDPHRSSYPEEPEQRWYSGGDQYPERGQYQDPDWDYRAPEPRGTGAADRYAPPPRFAGGPTGPRSGEPLPPLPDLPPPREPMGARDQGPAPDDPRFRGEPDRPGSRRQGGPAPAGDGIYRARRPAVAILVGVAAVALAVPALRNLLRSAFGPLMSVSGTVASSLILIALPLGAIGLYGLATGAARVPYTPPVQSWLRPPLAYLVICLVLCLAAGLAAR